MQSPWLTTHSKYIIIYGNNKEIDQTQGTGKGAHEEARRRFESYYLDIYVDGKRSYEFLKLYLLPEINPMVKEQNRATKRR